MARSVPGRKHRVMLTTYEFYVAKKDSPPRFVPVLCGSELELMRHAREMLAQEAAEFVEVRRGGEVLLRLVS